MKTVKFLHQNKIKQIGYPIVGRILPLHIFMECKLYGFSFLKWHNFFKKSQWYSQEEIYLYQKRNLRRIVQHCYEHVPFYRSSFETSGVKPQNIKELSDLSKLPIINKDIFKIHLQQFVAENISKFSPLEWHTGGSTGKPLHFYRDKKLSPFISSINFSSFIEGSRHIFKCSNIKHHAST